MLSSLLPKKLLLEEVVYQSRQGLCGLRIEELARVSKIVERFLREHTPEIVTAAHALSEEVVFVPVSSLGTSPVTHPDPDKQQGFYVRSGSIKPQWAEVPLLYALHRTSKGLIPGLKAKS